MVLEGKRLALFIASYQYEDANISQLAAPGQDAEALAQVLQDPEIGNFEVKTLINEPSYKVKREINRFFVDKDRDDLLLLYFSGHGIKNEDGQLYFATLDTEYGLLYSTSISASFINNLMLRSSSRRQILLLDCCYGGAFAKGVVVKNDNRVDIKERFEGRGRVILTASDSMQFSFEGKEIKGEGSYSIFTHHLVRGLKTGDADEDKDGYISLDDLYDYAYSKVLQEQPNQHPQKWAFDVQGKIIIARSLQQVYEKTYKKEEGVTSLNLNLSIDLVLSSRQLQIGTNKTIFIENKFIEISIPPQLKNNESICLAKKGKLNPITEERGDLYVKIIEDNTSDTLVSVKGVNYSKLRDLLALGKWKEADDETYKVILSASKRTQERWLSGEDIQQFPYQDLSTIDDLWMRYSDNTFGFSIQKEILNNSKGKPLVFAELVGWYVKGNWIPYKELNFSLTAPAGHLPWLPNFILWKDSPKFLKSDGLEAFLERIILKNVSSDIILKKLSASGQALVDAQNRSNNQIAKDKRSGNAVLENIFLSQDLAESEKKNNHQQITGG